ncbi:phosphate-selective porin [Novosphingobium hassiacum]|uniref:Phosphate-selective porin n=1 Tax=Novosphingobium hassiacum TaxID=173676 RepID=A0A7W6EVX0_9SPHN|nr:porin [Novosphingobium hassiacum]MBB3860792.1 phosphate-selective porin [Novosphingobium hassiacum]
MTGKAFRAALAATVFISAAGVAQAQAAPQAQDAKIADLQRQVDELKAMVRAMQAAHGAAPVVIAQTPATSAPAATTPQPVQMAAVAAPAPVSAPEKKKAWYEKLQLRGYTQLRMNEIISGDKTAPAGRSRLRSVQDSGINENGNLSIRRARLVVQGDISNRVSLYLQGDLSAAVSNQSGSEPRQNFFQRRDAYADVYLDKAKTLKLRLGQSKVPFGWENLQSSSNRVPLDRTDAINSPVPGERDIGVVAYYTPSKIQAIWDELTHDGQKLFGNYGALGVGVYNGQGTNRIERNGSYMTVAMATMPFRLDGLGGMFEGQVAEFGASGILNKFRPEIRSGGVSAVDYDDNHVGAHAMIYPKPFGIQAEWTWGRTPEFDRATGTIKAKDSSGGYVMAMVRVPKTPIGQIIPFARYQTYRGGWKVATNAPRLETEEYEIGVEWLPLKELEVTLNYANVSRTEADERRTGRAKGDLVRAQVQWNY